ncbi:MAG: hypothetical protein ACR2I0_10885, partial [Rhodoferax sp.]
GERASLCVRDNLLDWIAPQGWLTHNLDRALGHSEGLPAAAAARMERRLLATYQTTSQLQSTNRILPSAR